MSSTSEATTASVAEIWAAGARAVAEAVCSPLLATHWDRPSVLSEQSVGVLASHVARGGIWVAADYLGAEPSSMSAAAATLSPTLDSAAHYFAHLATALTDEDHRAIRARSARGAKGGHEGLRAVVGERLEATIELVTATDPDRSIAVFGGIVMRLGDYLGTRIVEQVVHLDDLARSISSDDAPDSHPWWSTPEDCIHEAARIGHEIALLRHGSTAVMRALFRSGFATEIMPVL